MARRKQQPNAVPITARALTQRINRKLRDSDEVIRSTRPNTRARVDLGQYYLLRFGTGASEPSTNIVETQVDIEAVGRELKVLRPYERLIDAEE